MKPTRKQLAYLKTLADRSGQTFTYPQTAAQASSEIERLKGAKATPSLERKREKRALERDFDQRAELDASSYRNCDVRGYGSEARWAHSPEAH